MRISSELVFNTALRTIQAQQTDFLHLYQQIGTGQKMVTPADDPLAASQAINLSQSLTLNQRYAENRAVARQGLAHEEQALDALTLALQDVISRVIEASNGSLSDSDRRSLASSLSGTRDTLLGIANATDGNGQYLFSGSIGDAPAFQTDGRYAGDRLPRLIQADQARQIDSADTGASIFERAQPGTRSYTTYADAGNSGTGVLAQPAIVNQQLGNSAADHVFTLTFETDSMYRIEVRDLQDQVVQTQAGQWSGDAHALPLGLGTEVQLSGQPQPGDRFEIRPLNHEPLNLFHTLDTLIMALRQPAQSDEVARASLRNHLNTANQQIHSLYDNVLTVRASVGTRLNELEALDDVGAQRNLGYRQTLSQLEDLDYHQAIIQLNLRQAALMGATQAFQAIQNLSLFSVNGGR